MHRIRIWQKMRRLPGGRTPWWPGGCRSESRLREACLAPTRGSCQGLPAVDADRMAGQKRVRHGKEDGGGNVLCGADPLDRIACAHLGEVVGLSLFTQGIPRPGIDDARRDSIDPYGSEFESEGTNEGVGSSVRDGHRHGTDSDLEGGDAGEDDERPAFILPV